MSFPNLVLRPGGAQWCEAVGVPDNGINVVTLDFDLPVSKIDPSWVDVMVLPLGPSVTDCTVVSIVGDVMTLNFTQAGADQARVVAHLEHTFGR